MASVALGGSASKKARLSRTKSAAKVKRSILCVKGEEENIGCAVNKRKQKQNQVKVKVSDGADKSIFVAAQSLVDLSHHYTYVLQQLEMKKENEDVATKNLGSQIVSMSSSSSSSSPSPSSFCSSSAASSSSSCSGLTPGLAEEEDKDVDVDTSILNSEPYRKRAQELLFRKTDILVGERKDAFFELVRQLCPYIDIVRSGSKTLRTYLVDTRKKKRYRTYSDAIKGGALDPLLLETGTVVLLKGCVDEAKRRYDMLVQKA